MIDSLESAGQTEQRESFGRKEDYTRIVERQLKKGRLVALIGVEGGHMIEDSHEDISKHSLREE
jgi:hypothetical protein